MFNHGLTLYILTLTEFHFGVEVGVGGVKSGDSFLA